MSQNECAMLFVSVVGASAAVGCIVFALLRIV